MPPFGIQLEQLPVVQIFDAQSALPSPNHYEVAVTSL
jgi:hypothetical protein